MVSCGGSAETTDADRAACLTTGALGSASCTALTVGDVEDCANATGSDICQTSTAAACAAVNRCIPIDSRAAEIARTICPKAYQCCTADQLLSNASAGTTEAECEQNTTRDYRTFLMNVQKSQDAGRCRYERSKLDACLATLRTSTCATLNMTNHITGVPTCDGVTTPLVAIGGACSNDFECVGGGVCLIPQGAVEGTCVAGATVGQSCVDTRCAPGLSCDPRDSGNATDDVCVQPQAEGATCADDGECRSQNCAAPAAGGPMTCMATPLCFYSYACSAAGRPNAGTLLIGAALLTLAAIRRRRARRGTSPRARCH